MIAFGHQTLLAKPQLNLIGGLEHEWIMTFHSVGNGKIIPTDELHHFSEG